MPGSDLVVVEISRSKKTSIGPKLRDFGTRHGQTGATGLSGSGPVQPNPTPSLSSTIMFIESQLHIDLDGSTSNGLKTASSTAAMTATVELECFHGAKSNQSAMQTSTSLTQITIVTSSFTPAWMVL